MNSTWDALLPPLVYFAYYGFGVYLMRAAFSPASAQPDRSTLFTLRADGREVRFWNRMGRRHRYANSEPMELLAQADFAGAGRVELMLEKDAGERLFKAFGFARELRTGYSRFDERCYVMAEHRDFALALLSDGRRRDAVLRLLDAGATHLLFAGGTVTAAFPLAGPRAVSQSDAHRFAEELAELARPPAPKVSERDLGTARVALVRRLLAHGLAVLPLAAWVLMRLDPHEYPLVDAQQWTPLGLKFLGGMLLAIPAAAALLLWGQPQAPRDLFAIACLGLVAMGTQSDEVAVWLNGRLDRVAPLERVVPVVDDRESRHLTVHSWRPGRQYEQVPVPRALYEEARPGIDKLRIATRPGAFGVEWVTGVQLVAGEAKPLTAGNRLWLGWEQMNKGDLKGAEAEFRQAMALDPASFEARRYLDAVLSKQGRWPEIVSLWDAFLAEQPGHAGAHFERAGTHRHAGNMHAAMQDLARACELGEKRACGVLNAQKARAP